MNPPEDRRQLGAWLRFEDWLDYSVEGPSVIVRSREEQHDGTYPLPGWWKHGFVSHCALVAPDDVAAALDSFRYDVMSRAEWSMDHHFSFGNVSVGTLELEPLVLELPKAGAFDAKTDIRQDFALYHQLRRTPDGNYRHPYEELLVCEIAHYQDAMDIPARVRVNLDYLRDYLAARRKALLWTITIDRFAARNTRDAFDIDPHDYMRLTPGTWRQIDLSETPPSEARSWLARGSLYLTRAILPYDEPREERNPWSITSRRPPSSSTISFIIDSIGTRATALELDPPPMVLYFKRQVLERYMLTPGYSAFFITRRWGRAVTARGRGVDIGLNSQGLITAFAKDVLELHEDDQRHWSAYSAPVNGEVCRDWFQTRMMLKPPAVVDAVRLITDAKTHLSVALTRLVGEAAFGDAEPSSQQLNAVRVGPLTDTPTAFCGLAMTLCQLAVDPLRESALRKAFPGDSSEKGKRSVSLLEDLLVVRCGVDREEAKAIVSPLRTLNWLRQEAAHLAVEAFRTALAELGFVNPPDRLWEAWDELVDRTAESLRAVARCLESACAD